MEFSVYEGNVCEHLCDASHTPECESPRSGTTHERGTELRDRRAHYPIYNLLYFFSEKCQKFLMLVSFFTLFL